MNNFRPTEYLLQSVKTNQQFSDKGFTLEAPGEKEPTLIRAVYEEIQINVGEESMGVFRFSDWLPINRFLEGSSAPVTYKSEALAKHLGIENLYITFSGYWPEKGANMLTCSFKETEAYAVCARINPEFKGTLVVASAGNTARAFARVCSDNNIRLLLCVPEDNLDALWFDKPIKSNVKLVSTKSGSDYFDAISLANDICALSGFFAEGGAKNVARRDGMGTTVLSAVNFIGKIPDYYFQAVGSGTGAIAAWEANDRLIVDGRFGRNKMKLVVSQNAPFTPIYDAWKADSREILPLDDKVARKQVEQILGKVLANRKPPYSIVGGLYDALKDSDGYVVSVENEQILKAVELFENLEGIDINHSAAVAVASLISEVESGKVDKDSIIMLNVTGGGEKQFKQNNETFYLKPNHIFDVDYSKDDMKNIINALF